MKGYLLLIDSGTNSPHPVIDLLREEGYSVTTIQSTGGMTVPDDLEVFDLVLLLFAGNSQVDSNLIRELNFRVAKACSIFVIGPDEISQAVKAMHCGATYYWPHTADSVEIAKFIKEGSLSSGRRGFGLRREETLLQVIKEIALTMELDGLVNILVDSAMELAGADAGVLLLLDEKTNHLVPRAVRGFSDLESGMEFLGLPESRCFDILQGKLPILLHSTDPPVFAAKQPVKALMVIPVWFKDSALGELVLAKFATSGSNFSKDDFQLLSLFSGEISAAVYNAITHYKTKELTIKDDLTDAYNRRYFDQFLEQEFHRALRYNSHLSLIFFDVDNLKEVNAKYGHLTGSKTLQEVAHRMILVVRGIDKVVRYGGDEFCIVLPETDSQGAYQVADRLRITIAGRPFRINESIQVTLTGSFGIACFPDHATTKDELIRQADRAMFSIKNRTKNAIAVASVAG